MGKTGRELFDDYIKIDWPQEVKAAGVKKRNNTAYVPVKRNVSLLREDVNALDEAVRLWSDENAEGSSPGYDAIVEQAGVEFTWEYALIDPARPWANDVPPEIRARIERYFASDLDAFCQREGDRRRRIGGDQGGDPLRAPSPDEAARGIAICFVGADRAGRA